MSDQVVTAARKVDFAKWDELFDSAKDLLIVIGLLKSPAPAEAKRDLLERYELAKDRAADAIADLELLR